MDKPALVKEAPAMRDDTVPLNEAQVALIKALETQVVTAMRDREVALRMVLAGASRTDAQITGYDFEAKVLKVRLAVRPGATE